MPEEVCPEWFSLLLSNFLNELDSGETYSAACDIIWLEFINTLPTLLLPDDEEGPMRTT